MSTAPPWPPGMSGRVSEGLWVQCHHRPRATGSRGAAGVGHLLPSPSRSSVLPGGQDPTARVPVAAECPRLLVPCRPHLPRTTPALSRGSVVAPASPHLAFPRPLGSEHVHLEADAVLLSRCHAHVLVLAHLPQGGRAVSPRLQGQLPTSDRSSW